MANVFYVFVPTSTPGSHPLRIEMARNTAVPEHALKERARMGSGPTHYIDETEADGIWSQRPRVEFPDADMSAFLVVWKRRAADDWPTVADTPDEIWSLTPRGGLVREPLAPDGTRIPGPYDDAPEAAPLPPRVILLASGDDGADAVTIRDHIAPVRALCNACDTMPRADGRCRCSS